ncbi:MAG TPA: CpaF family protein [Chloroflexota bacterium]|nr:CpaF family protein [Chloroflexota bacterium]
MLWPPKQTAQPKPGNDGRSNGVETSASQPGTTIVETAYLTPSDPFVEIKFRVHEELLRQLDLEKVQQKQGAELRKAIEEAAGTMLAAQETPLSRQERLRLVREVADEVLGFGPLEPLLADPTVTEVMVNAPRRVYFERKGLLHLSEVVFRDEAHIMRIIDKIISPLGRRVDESSPMVDARLPDGSRVNAIIPPLAVDSPTITIRKFARDPLTVENMIEFGTFTPEIAAFLKACVESRINTVISGGTGSGKTTLLNVLSAFIPPRERIVTIEDPCELQMRQPHVVRLETRPANIEGKGEVTQRQLVKNALRMRPDRIVVGEVRSGEAFDMLQAMNTGHDGSLTTVHSNTPRDALARIENMVLMASLDLPVRAIREQVASAINLIVHLSRLRDGSRRVTHVTEVVGMEGEMVTMQDIFLFHQQGFDQGGRVRGGIQATGLRPRCVDKFEQEGIVLPGDLFAQRAR